MSTKEIRQKLFDCIREADEKKVKAFYTIIESEIKNHTVTWTDGFLAEMDRRTLEFEQGKVTGYTWEEVQTRAKQATKAKRTS
jgi:hypothetical protein